MSDKSLTIDLKLTGKEVFSSAEAPWAKNENQRTLNSANKNNRAVLDDSSTTPQLALAPCVQTVTVGGAGSTSVDLTSLPGLVLPDDATRTIDGTGYKIVAARFKTPSDNAGNITIKPGLTNAYELFGTSNEVDIPPGHVVVFGAIDAAAASPTIAAGVKEIEVDGTVGDTVDMELYLGT